MCPKDPFPMPKINQLVDAIYGHPRMSFLNAFQGYHQIALATEDQEKIAFISPNANYHYTVMPFGLKKCWGHISTDDNQNVSGHNWIYG